MSDVLTWLVEGYQRGVLVTEAADIDERLTPALEAELATYGQRVRVFDGRWKRGGLGRASPLNEEIGS